MAGFAKDIWPYVSLSSTATSITVYVSPAVSAIFDTPGANYCNISCNNVNSEVISTGTFYTFYGLSPNSSYSIIIDVMYAAGYDGNYGYDSGIGYTISSIDPWYWNSSELNAFNNRGNFSVLTAYRWNQFCDKINEVCVAAGSSWLANYTTLSGAKASGSGVSLTALMFNSVRFNIGSRASTGIAEVSTGGTIYGSYFITLQDKLNQWIASL